MHVDGERVKVVEAFEGHLAVGARAAVVIVVDGDARRGHDAGCDVMDYGSLVRVGHVGDVDLPATDLPLALREVGHHVHSRLELHVLAMHHHACTHTHRRAEEEGCLSTTVSCITCQATFQ